MISHADVVCCLDGYANRRLPGVVKLQAIPTAAVWGEEFKAIHSGAYGQATIALA